MGLPFPYNLIVQFIKLILDILLIPPLFVYDQLRKLIYHVRLRCYIIRLRRLKRDQVERRLRIRHTISAEQFLVFILLQPYYMLKYLLLALFASVKSFLVTDARHTRQLCSMLDSHRPESRLLRFTLLFLFSVVFTIVYFYIEMYLLEKYSLSTLIFTIVFFFVVAIAPLLTTTGRAISAIVLPSTLGITLRAILIGFLLVDIHRNGWDNINTNLEIINEVVSCDYKSFVHLSKTLQSKSSYNQDSIIVKFGHTISDIAQAFLWIFRAYLTTLDRLCSAVKVVFQFFDKLTGKVNKFVQEYWFLNSIIEWKVVANAMVNIFTTVFDSTFEGIKSKFKTIKDKTLSELKKQFHASYKANYEFHVHNNVNLTFRQLFGGAKQQILERHFYLIVLAELLVNNYYLFVLWSFIKVFGFSILYYLRYKSIRSHDNYYLTDQLRRHAEKMEEDGNDALFPLRKHERALYIEFFTLSITYRELTSLAINLIIDITFLFYIGGIYLLDHSLYEKVLQINKVFKSLSEDIVDYSRQEFPQEESITFLMSILKISGTNLKAGIETFQAQIRGCLQEPSRPFGYRKAFILITIQIVYTMFQPYFNRIRPYALDRLYPQRAQVRAEWLYNKILLDRKTYRSLFMALFSSWLSIENPRRRMKKAKTKVTSSNGGIFIRFVESLLVFFGLRQQKFLCQYCVMQGRRAKKTKLKCLTWCCDAYLCLECYKTFTGRCEDCRLDAVRNKEDYSEEKDSSSEDIETLLL